jgi:hypothetical protein
VIVRRRRWRRARRVRLDSGHLFACNGAALSIRLSSAVMRPLTLPVSNIDNRLRQRPWGDFLCVGIVAALINRSSSHHPNRARRPTFLGCLRRLEKETASDRRDGANEAESGKHSPCLPKFIAALTHYLSHRAAARQFAHRQRVGAGASGQSAAARRQSKPT